MTVTGIFIFASYSASTSSVFLIPRGSDKNQTLPYCFLSSMATGTIAFPVTPFSQNPSDEENFPAELKDFNEAFGSNIGIFNIRSVRNRNKAAYNPAERILGCLGDNSLVPAILEINFYNAENICAKAFYDVKTTRKLE